jgi:hypothetical protein
MSIGPMARSITDRTMKRSTEAEPNDAGPIPLTPSSVSISTNAACRASLSPAPERTRCSSGMGQWTR